MAESIEISSSREEAQKQQVPAGSCACGGHDEALPEMDVQAIPHAVRHAAIFGALGSLRPGTGMILSATHNPVPLLNQLNERHPGEFEVAYLAEGPEAFKLKIVRN